MRKIQQALAALVLLSASGLLIMSATAYEFDPLGNKWPGARTTI